MKPRENSARAELDKYGTRWGLQLLVLPDVDETISNEELLLSYLACSIAFTNWESVYRQLWSAREVRVSSDELVQTARKACPLGDPISKRYASRSRDAKTHVALLQGAVFGETAKTTPMYQELRAIVPELLLDSWDVMLFHLVGTSNVMHVLDDPALGLTRMLLDQERRQLAADLQCLASKWALCKEKTQIMILLVDCHYPVLEQLGSDPIVQQPHQRAAVPSRRTAAASRSTVSEVTAFPPHASSPWTTAVERRFAEDARFRRYKQRKGWPAYYGSRPTLESYLNDVKNGDDDTLNDFRAMDSKEVIALAECLASHSDPAKLLNTEQCKHFANALVASAVPSQLKGWTTKDIAIRLFVAHHPEWQTHYSYAWNADRTTINEIAAYLERWPSLPSGFVPPVTE